MISASFTEISMACDLYFILVANDRAVSSVPHINRVVRQSFIVCPESDDFDGLDVSQYLIHKPMLNIDAP